jgi:hypothetical protein
MALHQETSARTTEKWLPVRGWRRSPPPSHGRTVDTLAPTTTSTQTTSSPSQVRNGGGSCFRPPPPHTHTHAQTHARVQTRSLHALHSLTPRTSRTAVTPLTPLTCHSFAQGMVYSGNPYLQEQSRLVVERSGAFLKPNGQLPHHFVDDKPTYLALSGATQTGPNTFWTKVKTFLYTGFIFRFF